MTKEARKIEEQATFNMVYQWFLGLSTEELPPDHTTLCRFRLRLVAEGFQRLCNQVVAQARAKGVQFSFFLGYRGAILNNK